MAAIETRALTKVYGRPLRSRRVRALEDLSIDVREGEIFGFLGPNGAGKSTMIRLLLGFLHPTAGEGRVLGHDIERENVAIRGRVGYLPGGIALYDSMTGSDLLDYLGRLYGRPSRRRQELCDRLELDGAALRRPVRDYSRGMRQKIGIIQALQHDPELAILDEPSEGLDPLMQQAFYAILEDLRKEGRTIFFSSHILPEVERICDRVAIVRRGRLVALEDIEALLSRRRRHVELRHEGVPPALGGIPGVSALRVSDGMVTCLLQGDVGPFLRALASVEVKDLTIRPASLEDAFLEYYAEDIDRADGAGASLAGRERNAVPIEPAASPVESASGAGRSVDGTGPATTAAPESVEPAPPPAQDQPDREESAVAASIRHEDRS